MTHDLKILPEYFLEVYKGNKTFEIRKNDRDYREGDIIKLNEFNCGKYTGNYIKAKVGFITDYEQKENYVVFSIKIKEKIMNF